MDIPEFYDLVKELFTPQEAGVAAAMPRKPSTARAIAQEMGRNEKEIATVLENMANKGLCTSFEQEGKGFYVAIPFVPGIFEFQFMRGTRTDRDRKVAKLIQAYEKAVDAARGPQTITFPGSRVIPVEKTIRPGSKVHTYDQVSSYIDRYDPISVTTCFCRHEGKLLDEKSDCGKPDDVCMQFGVGAKFVIERELGPGANLWRRSKCQASQVCSGNPEGVGYRSGRTHAFSLLGMERIRAICLCFYLVRAARGLCCRPGNLWSL
jgi:hypothetical protein